MRDVNGAEEGIQVLIFTTPISMHGKNLAIKHSFNKAFIEVDLQHFHRHCYKSSPLWFFIVEDLGL
jgi:hypothetical protein